MGQPIVAYHAGNRSPCNLQSTDTGQICLHRNASHDAFADSSNPATMTPHATQAGAIVEDRRCAERHDCEIERGPSVSGPMHHCAAWMEGGIACPAARR